MKSFSRFLALAGVLGLAAGLFESSSALHDPRPVTEALAMASEDGPAPAGRDVDGPVLWSILGVAVGAIVMGGLHLLKRALGGFPENPSWVAPISVERSSTFLDETKSGDLPVQSGAAHH